MVKAPIPEVKQQVNGVRSVTHLPEAILGQLQATPLVANNSEHVINAKSLRRLGAADPARKVPSQTECGFCPITHSDCPERRVHQEDGSGETDDF